MVHSSAADPTASRSDAGRAVSALGSARRSHRGTAFGLFAGLLLSAVGCSSPRSENVPDSSMATSLGSRSLLEQSIDTVAGWLPFHHDASPAAQRERMQEQAGVAHFRQEELGAGREEMARHRAEFAEQREGFVSSDFTRNRERLRTGRFRPAAGPVIGPSLRQTLADPDLARALLAGVAASQGVSTTQVQPILAQLLPGFGF